MTPQTFQESKSRCRSLSKRALWARRPGRGGRRTSRGRLALGGEQLADLLKARNNSVHFLSKQGDRRGKGLLGLGQIGESGSRGRMCIDKGVNSGVEGSEAVLERSAPGLKRSHSFTEGSVSLGGRGSGRSRWGRGRWWSRGAATGLVPATSAAVPHVDTRLQTPGTFPKRRIR